MVREESLEEQGPKMTPSLVRPGKAAREASKAKTDGCQEATVWSLGGNPSAVRTHWKCQAKGDMISFTG